MHVDIGIGGIKMNKLSELEKAYIAGLLDGEGCIGVDRIKSQATVWQYDFKLRIIITNTNADVLLWLKEVTGVGCFYMCKKSSNPNWRPVHRWQIVSEQARNFLLEVLPYLKIKKEISNLVLLLPIIPPIARKRAREESLYIEQNRVYGLAKDKNRRGAVLN